MDVRHNSLYVILLIFRSNLKMGKNNRKGGYNVFQLGLYYLIRLIVIIIQLIIKFMAKLVGNIILIVITYAIVIFIIYYFRDELMRLVF